MWNSFKAWLVDITPELILIMKALIKIGVVALYPVATNAVKYAEAHGGSGPQKLDLACNYVKANAPNALAGAVLTAVQDMWAYQEANGWK